MRVTRSGSSPSLVRHGRRVTLRTMSALDYDRWIEVRQRCRDWLVPWEPRPAGAPEPAEGADGFHFDCMRSRLLFSKLYAATEIEQRAEEQRKSSRAASVPQR